MVNGYADQIYEILQKISSFSRFATFKALVPVLVSFNPYQQDAKIHILICSISGPFTDCFSTHIHF